MKKVDVIFPCYINATIGPTGTLRRLLSNKDYIKKRGYEIDFFTYDYLVSKGESSSVSYSRGLKFRSKIKNLIKHSKFASILFKLRTIRNADLLVKHYLKLCRKPDIVIFHEIDACYSFMKRCKSNPIVICFFHSDGTRWNMFLKSWPKIANTRFLEYLDRRVDFVIRSLDCSVFIAKIGQENFLLENPFIMKEKTFFFHNGIDDKPLEKKKTKNDDVFNICCVGTICQRKGQYLLIEAFNNLPQEIKDRIHISLYGTGPDINVLEQLVEKYKMTNNVSFYGNVPNEKIHSLLCNEDIFILMSNNEGLPISIIEAMRAGLPIISTFTSGIPELVTPLYNGILVNCEMKALLSILVNIDKYNWASMGENSRKRFENEFNFSNMLCSYCDMLDYNVIKNKLR